MSVALIELVEMTATLNVVVSINSTTVMQTYWDSPILNIKYNNTIFKVQVDFENFCVFTQLFET